MAHIYYGDKVVGQLRDGKGKYSKVGIVRRFVGKCIKLSVISLSFVLVAYILLQVGSNLYPQTVYAVQEKLTDSLEVKITQLKSELVKDLQKCESAGYNENDGILIFDSNKKASIGTLQFQKDTIIHYYKTLYSKDITKKEAVLIALDNEKAEQLASDIIFETEKGYRNWLNCSNKHGLAERVKFIKGL